MHDCDYDDDLMPSSVMRGSSIAIASIIIIKCFNGEEMEG